MGERYDQCDGTCTVDCGHCKGKGKPADPTDVELVARALFDGDFGQYGSWEHWTDEAASVVAFLNKSGRWLPPGGVEREEERKDFERLISIGPNQWRPTVEVRTVTDFPDGLTLTGPWRPVTVKDEDQ